MTKTVKYQMKNIVQFIACHRAGASYQRHSLRLRRAVACSTSLPARPNLLRPHGTALEDFWPKVCELSLFPRDNRPTCTQSRSYKWREALASHSFLKPSNDCLNLFSASSNRPCNADKCNDQIFSSSMERTSSVRTSPQSRIMSSTALFVLEVLRPPRRKDSAK
jgi:hypothetical protein